MWTRFILRFLGRDPGPRLRPDPVRTTHIDERLDRVESDLRVLTEDIEAILRRDARRMHGD